MAAQQKKMNKTQLNYLEDRIKQVVRCTNGEIATKLNGRRKSATPSDEDYLQMIRDGKATLKLNSEIIGKTANSYSESLTTSMVRCYDFELTKEQKEAEKFNNALEAKIDDLHREVELEGKRLLDKAALNILDDTKIPDALHALGEMAALANTTL